MVDVTFVRRSSGGSFTDVGFVRRREGANWVQVWPRVSISDTTMTRFTTAPAQVYYEVQSGGTVHKTGPGGEDIEVETWLLVGSASDYEIMVTVNSSTVPLGGSATATWLSLGTTRSWTLTDSTADAVGESAEILVQIRDATSHAILDSATITMSAQGT